MCVCVHVRDASQPQCMEYLSIQATNRQTFCGKTFTKHEKKCFISVT